MKTKKTSKSKKLSSPAQEPVEEKTQELRPGGGGTSGGSSGVIDTRMGAGRPTKPFKFPAE